MSSICLVKDVIIPIICAIIGGAFTYGGVILTIKHEKKKEEEKNILQNKPLFWRINPMQDYDYKKTIVYAMECKDDREIILKDLYSIYGIFKNTDNAIFIIKYIVIKNKKYFPINGDVVDKNQIFQLYIKMKEEYEKDTEVILVVNDILNNEYRYKLEINEENNVENFYEN